MHNKRSKFGIMTLATIAALSLTSMANSSWAKSGPQKKESLYQCAVINKPVHEKNLSAKDIRSLTRTFDQAKANGAIESIELGTVVDNDEKAVVIVKVSEPE